MDVYKNGNHSNVNIFEYMCMEYTFRYMGITKGFN